MNMSLGRLVFGTISSLKPQRPSGDSAAYGLSLPFISQYHRAIDSCPVFWLNRNTKREGFDIALDRSMTNG